MQIGYQSFENCTTIQFPNAIRIHLLTCTGVPRKERLCNENQLLHSTSFEICAMKICLKSLTFLHMFLTHEKHQKDVLKVGTAAMPTFLKGFLTQQRKRGYF